MTLPRDRSENISNYLKQHKIARLDDLKAVVGSNARMTVLRALSRLGYISSYSHRGQYYTLPQIPDFDDVGLWSCESVRFSKSGNLLTTAKAMIEKAEAGYTAQELENILNVEAKHALLQLTRRGDIDRCKIGRSHVYTSSEQGRKRQQRLWREDRKALAELGMGQEADVMPDEIKAGITILFSMFDEQQRRLYAGLEAAKLGHGGDRMVAQLLGLDVHTVAKGRKDLLGEIVDRSRVRKEGAGRKKVEKKTLT